MPDYKYRVRKSQKKRISLYRPFLFLLFLLFIFLQFLPDDDLKVNLEKIEKNFIPVEEGSVEVLFTHEDDVAGRIKSLLVGSADIRCAFYDIDDENIIKTLMEKDAGLILDDSTTDLCYQDSEISSEKPGLHLTCDASRKLMHNKFCILDSRIVITGSLNPTFRGFEKNDNNLIIINSSLLAQNYLEEFEEMSSGVFHDGKRTRQPQMFLSGKLVENYFCPEDSCQEVMLQHIEEAQESIYFMYFSFTDKMIAESILMKEKEGVFVSGIFEKTQAGNSYSVFPFLENFSVLDSNPANMHHKVMIIDNSTVITGSYNPSKNGDENNDENILIIHDEEISRFYLDEFSRIKAFPKSVPDTDYGVG